MPAKHRWRASSAPREPLQTRPSWRTAKPASLGALPTPRACTCVTHVCLETTATRQGGRAATHAPPADTTQARRRRRVRFAPPADSMTRSVNGSARSAPMDGTNPWPAPRSPRFCRAPLAPADSTPPGMRRTARWRAPSVVGARVLPTRTMGRNHACSVFRARAVGSKTKRRVLSARPAAVETRPTAEAN